MAVRCVDNWIFRLLRSEPPSRTQVVSQQTADKVLTMLESAVDEGTGEHTAVEVVARDEGPGIPDVERAMEDGYSTGRGLGLGLPGARRLMDTFEITSEVGVGTTVVMRKRRST